jgi:hypothetical protein
VKARHLAVAVAVSVTTLAPPITAGGEAGASKRPYLGTYGTAPIFDSGTHPIRHVIVGWGQGQEWGSKFSVLLPSLGKVPMLGFGSKTRSGELTAAAIAQGAGDAFLIALNAALQEYGSLIYVRPLGEMDGSWNPYCAFNDDGSPRSPAHSTKNFRKAFARIYLLLHGGSKQALDAKLRALRLPGVGRDLPVNPSSLVRVVWNPLGYPNPAVAGNAPAQYYPGDAYVDVVGGDVYKTPTNAGHLTALEALYDRYKKKPFSIPEWGLQSVDDPDFVRRVAAFVRSHPRTEAVVLYSRGAEYSLFTKPQSLAAYKSAIVPLGRPG